ncbi:MAG: ATP-dependent protease ATPase subunit HslU [Spirochaetaceae bacterium]|jgi:ATP-dependent HslUV protease ATP-binding subunit HslU|nr:ATP-dependent protease ATPase subunit HslU [Spirochaetaceae bacterium]
MKIDLDKLTPREIVTELDKYIIGQENAKKSVAIALRNRLRRSRLPEDIKDEVAPKNIIMIGPTGVGKTEIARRLSKLSGAPFLKVEATKFTEVGYVGRDVESMVRDLMASAVSMVKTELQEGVQEEAEKATEEALLDILLPAVKPGQAQKPGFDTSEQSVIVPADNSTREKFRQMLREGKLDDREVEITISKQKGMPSIEIFSGNSFEEMDFNLGSLSGMFGGGKKKKSVNIKKAREILLAEHQEKLVDSENAADLARDRVQNMGIIFIDEIDKIATRKNSSGGGQDVSREGVQRDILPIVEGSKVNTKYGIVDTSHILFIAAGAFTMSKPSDLIPELQGRFPLRVELQDLNAEAFKIILTVPKNSLTKQYVELLKTEDVHLDFKEDAIDVLAQIAEDVNKNTENIGARRLHTIMELLLEEVSFNAPDLQGQTIFIDAKYVNDKLKDIVEDRDLSRYIL